MIFAFEHLKEFDKKLINALEPYIDFQYSFKAGMYYWQRHHLIIDNKDIYKLRLHKGNNLKQGFICTDFDEAKYLAILLEKNDDIANLKKTYTWLERYLNEKKENHWLEIFALPVSEYIKHYSNDFKQLQLLDFEKIFSFRDKKK